MLGVGRESAGVGFGMGGCAINVIRQSASVATANLLYTVAP